MSVNMAASIVSTTVSGLVLHKETGDGIPNLQVDLFDMDNWADPELPQILMAAGTSLTSVSGAAADAGNPAAAGGDGGQAAAAASSAYDPTKLYYVQSARIGSALTDDSGAFSFDVLPRDFNLQNTSTPEQRPDLLLVVLAPDEPGISVADRLLFMSSIVRWNAGHQEAYIVRLSTDLLDAKAIPLGQGHAESKDSTQQRVNTYIARYASDLQFNAGVAEFHGAMATAEIGDRQTFRDTFVKSIATDYSTVPITGVMLQPGDSIQTANTTTVNTGIARVNDAVGDPSTQGVPVNLYLTPEDRTRLHQYFDNPTGDFVNIPESDLENILFRSDNTDEPGALLIHNNPIGTFIAQESADETCAKVHAGLEQDGSSPDGPAGSNGSEPTTISNSDIPGYLARVVADIPSPDTVLNPDVAGRRASQSDIDKAVGAFSLQKGPAENPAFYDFNTLQIAFDHVWQQLLDESIPNLAYTANTMGKTRFGIDGIVSNVFSNGLTLGNWTTSLTPVDVPPVIARFFDITKEEYNDLSFAMRDQLLLIANQVNAIQPGTIDQLRIVQRLTEQGDRIIDTVRHDDYYTLSQTLRELQAALNGTYEFTVFAADKDYHSVNFGLLITYRQQWTPLMYQAGPLVKSIPLAPREERKYSVKTTRSQKRSRKEAEKNNSSITTDESTTSRVEAEIMSKAQTKTAFSVTASGDYDIGISDGKASTSFGVDALSESSQNRKDFREAVLKAVQEYKSETSTELTTETEFGSEYTESGTITNPNDELAVTYLFYELQKRYRVDEQIYRVMPVVLVAQEMPLPNQITEAWVIAHDWILNRYLLDDSFRPTLAYLANKSVGDDYALRELGKNLRQERNLVETLQIEFSAASVEANNRYKALEDAISQRIDEEHRSDTEGIGDDFLDFFGGGGPDPQAAKARELAAQDAQRYAEEKAQKAEEALQQEVANLHTLTDQYNKVMQEKLDNETKVKRLLDHIAANITYYMHGIWSMEPPDQRYLRLYKVQVPVLELDSRSYSVKVQPDPDIFQNFREPGTEKHEAFLHGTLKQTPNGQPIPTAPLVEVADLDSLLGFKGNYMVFPLKQHNALTELMAAPYIDSAFGAMDPDQLSNISLDDYSAYVCRLHDTLPADQFDAMKPQLAAWLQQLLATPLRNGDEIVVPTHSLFIESLVDQNPILEDYKLKHRELDVYKVGEEVRQAALENLRRVSRLLNSELGDPDFDKQVIIAGTSAAPAIDVNGL